MSVLAGMAQLWRRLARRKRPSNAEWGVLDCAICGKWFYPTSPRAKYCGPPCRRVAKASNNATLYQRRKAAKRNEEAAQAAGE